MKSLLFLIGLTYLPIAAGATSRPATKGEELKKQGWAEIARCQSFRWSYLLSKKGEGLILCKGRYEHKSPIEISCEKFLGDASQYHSVTEAVLKQKLKAANKHKSLDLESAMKKEAEDPNRANCWEGYGQPDSEKAS